MQIVCRAVDIVFIERGDVYSVVKVGEVVLKKLYVPTCTQGKEMEIAEKKPQKLYFH